MIRRSLTAGAAIVVLGSLWLIAAPARFGGQVSYAVVSGISMEPLLHHGDLVLLRPRSVYRIGEIVAYHNEELDRVVLHRIVGRSGPYYIFKGDNNSYDDPDRPTRNQLIGELWLTVPDAGAVLEWLHTPRNAAFATAALALALFSGGIADSRRRTRAARRRPGRPRTTAAPFHVGGVQGGPIAAAGVTALAAFGLAALVAYSHGPTALTPDLAAYSQQGTYSATARVSPDPLYPTGRVTTGQTMFVDIVHDATLGFRYLFTSPLPHAISGRGQLRLTLASGLGWSKQLPSPPARAFHGDGVDLTATVDLAALETTMKQYFKLSGEPDDTFSVTLTPDISIHGRIASVPTTNTFTPAPLTLLLDDNSFRIQDTTLGAAAPGQASANPLQPSSPGVINQPEPATVALAGLDPRVTTLRRIAVPGLLAALLLTLIGAALAKRRPPDAQPALHRYENILLPIATRPREPARGYVDVADLDHLARIAHTRERLVLHHQHGADHTFYLEDDLSTYRYRPQLPLAAGNDGQEPAPRVVEEEFERADTAVLPALGRSETGSPWLSGVPEPHLIGHHQP